MALLAMVDIIPVDLVIGVVVIMVQYVEVIMAFQMVHMELLQIAFLPHILKEDIYMMDILNNINNLIRT